MRTLFHQSPVQVFGEHQPLLLSQHLDRRQAVVVRSGTRRSPPISIVPLEGGSIVPLEGGPVEAGDERINSSTGRWTRTGPPSSGTIDTLVSGPETRVPIVPLEGGPVEDELPLDHCNIGAEWEGIIQYLLSVQ